MKINHPFNGDRKGTTLTEEVKAWVAAYEPKQGQLPQVKHEAYTKKYWAESGKGLVPAGNYTDPSTPEAAKAVKAIHRAFPTLTRHKTAIALNFQSADQLDRVRAEAGIVPKRAKKAEAEEPAAKAPAA